MRATIGWLATAAFVLGPTLAFLRVVPGLVGFILFALGGLIAFIIALSGIVSALRGRGLGRSGIALVTAAVFVVLASRGFGVPSINDFSTDTSDPPTFRHATALPANTGRDMSYPSAFADIQKTCCADLGPARLSVPPAEALARAERVARIMPGWEVTSVDREAANLEAIATTYLFGFHDDIVVRVRPEGTGSRVDIRSKSRDGKGDIGANASRIRAFLKAVQELK